MSGQGENIDRSAVDQENLDYFKTLIRHLQRIPDNKILLFRQEVDALLLKYAHHYVKTDPAAPTRETRRKKYESSESESEPEYTASPPPKVEKRKTKSIQAIQSKRMRKSKKVSSSDDDDVQVVKEFKSLESANVSSVKEEPPEKSSVKKERNGGVPAHLHQEAGPTGTSADTSQPGTSSYDEQRRQYPPQPYVPNSHYNNSGYYGHYDYNRHYQDMPPRYNNPPTTQNGYPSAPHPPQHPSHNREMQPGFYRPPPGYGPVHASHPPQNPPHDRGMPPGFHPPPPAYGHSNPLYAPHYSSGPTNFHNSQAPNEPHQQHASAASSGHSSNGSNTHTAQGDHERDAASKSAHSVTNTAEIQELSQNQSTHADSPVQLVGIAKPSEGIEQNDKI